MIISQALIIPMQNNGFVSLLGVFKDDERKKERKIESKYYISREKWWGLICSGKERILVGA